LEEAAKIAIIARGMPVRTLSRDAIDELNTTFRLR